MRATARNYLFLGIIFYFAYPSHTCAQGTVNDTATRDSAIANAIRHYQSFAAPPTALYNGPEYVEYFKTLREGQPFFASTNFDWGTVMYDNIRYENVRLKFDIVKNELVTIDPSELFRITLFHDKISYFTIHGHTFIRIVKDSSARPLNTGFYDLLYKGRYLMLLKKEHKKLMTYVTERDGVKNVIEESRDFYTGVNNGYYRTNTKKAVLNLLKDKRPELKQYIRKNKLSFDKEETDKTLTSIVAYYESLKK